MAEHLRLAELREARRRGASQTLGERGGGLPVEAGDEHPALTRRAELGDERLVPGGGLEAGVRRHRSTSSSADSESVDVLFRVPLRHAVERCPTELRVARAERYAAQDSPLEERGVHLLDGAPARLEVDDPLLEAGSSEPARDEARDLREATDRVVAPEQDRLSQVTHAGRAEQREVRGGDDAGERRAAAGEVGRVASRLVGRRLEVPPEVVVLARPRGRHGDEIDRRQLGDELLVEPRDQETGRCAPGAHVVAERLEIAAGEIRAVAAWGRDDAEGDGVGADDQLRPTVVDELGDGVCLRVEDTEVARHLEVERGRPVELRCERVEVEGAGLGQERDLRRRHPGGQSRVDLAAAMRPGAAREEHARPSADPRRDQDRDRCAPAPVVCRNGGEIEVHELRDQALVLEQRLVGAERRSGP